MNGFTFHVSRFAQTLPIDGGRSDSPQETIVILSEAANHPAHGSKNLVFRGRSGELR
jgi:hypothetical protein